MSGELLTRKGLTLQVLGEMLSCRTRRVVLMSWESMIVFEMNPEYGSNDRSISVSPLIRREDGLANAGVIRDPGFLVSLRKDGIGFAQGIDQPNLRLKPTFVSTILALSLAPCPQSGPDFFPPDSVARVRRGRSNVDQPFQADPDAGDVPHLANAVAQLQDRQPRGVSAARRGGSGGGSRRRGLADRDPSPSERAVQVGHILGQIDRTDDTAAYRRVCAFSVRHAPFRRGAAS